MSLHEEYAVAFTGLSNLNNQVAVFHLLLFFRLLLFLVHIKFLRLIFSLHSSFLLHQS